MSSRSEPVDLFVSYDLSSAAQARLVVERLRLAGARVSDFAELSASGEYTNTVREALRDCDAYVAVVTAQRISANTVFEMGAALGADKPIFIIASDVTNVELPLAARRFHLLTIPRAEEIIRLVRSANAA